MGRGRVHYGWVLVGTLAFTEMTSWGVLYYAFSVFLVPMQEELGWSRAALTGAFSLEMGRADVDPAQERLDCERFGIGELAAIVDGERARRTRTLQELGERPVLEARIHMREIRGKRAARCAAVHVDGVA